ncbi:efflux RND transporter periplasmic adaptor subunit [Candidatus Fermentibacteria bacterium]|nr:efflux RND transporter periplasmic adaptor subunit [Candidatus Fermentibacteria bacterium]
MGKYPGKGKKWLIGAIVVIGVTAGILVARGLRRSGGAAGYEFTMIERGTLENIISGTGSLQAVGTVEVGTQVSGTIDTILVDYNDHVHRGQVLAVLDTTFLSAGVREARAGVLRAQSEYERARREYERDKDLYAKHFVTEVQYLDSKTSVETARASLLSAEASLDRAEANLRYAVITSPIEGTVIQRNNEPGQTVAASLSAPTLFLIAEDLATMEILGLVDESDIGSIREKMPVRFTVVAYPDREFEGTVRQIRLQPATVQNVVNYTVVIDAPNGDELLLPGMTATVDFIVERVVDTLLAPNAALRFQPTEVMVQTLRDAAEKRMSDLPDSLRARFAERRERLGAEAGGFPGRAARGGGVADMAQLWVLDEQGNLAMVPVRKGPTDGAKTVITPLRPQGPPSGELAIMPQPGIVVKEGLSVISGVKKAQASAQAKSNAAFSQRFGGPPGPPR